MKRIYLFFIILILCLHAVSAQVNNESIGIRFDSSERLGNELSWQKPIKENTRVEINLAMRYWGEYGGIAAYGCHQWIRPWATHLQWYYGGGLGIGYSQSRNSINPYTRAEGGILLNIGMEYTFPDLPFRISLDARPSVNPFWGRYGVWEMESAFALRYTFN